jgi:tripartite-type tricarboxylate transporter receptor subunit TctC
MRSRAGITAGLSILLIGGIHNATAQNYPAKPVRVLVGFTAGGAADVITRMVAQRLGEQTGQTFIVENRPGAGGAIATERVSTSPADGYTLLMMTAGDTALPALRAKLPYNLERDLAPVSTVAVSPFVLVVHPSVPARNVKSLMALAKSQPGKLSYGSAGLGTVAHLAGELFKAMGGVDIVQVPFKGGSESVIATVSGQLEMNFPNIQSVMPFIDSGKLVPIAVTTSRRAAALPKVPTMSESGLAGYDCSGWWALLAPAQTPKDVIERLNGLVVKAVSAPEMKELLNKQGFEQLTGTPEQLGTRIRNEIAQNAKLIKAAGIKPE